MDFVSRKENVGIREAALLIQEWFNVVPQDDGSSFSRNGRVYHRNGYQNAAEAY